MTTELTANGPPVLIAQGKANKIYKVQRGVLRVSKRNVEPQTVIEFGSRSSFKDYLPRMQVVDSCFGPAIFMDHLGLGGVLCEFKPKWLLQSPDAPANARQCRTCAIKQMREQVQKWCPLQLAAKHKLQSFFELLGALRAEEIADAFSADPLIDLLKQAQVTGSVFDPPTLTLLTAMSARDVTIIVEGPQPRIRLVDFDPKSLDKVDKWRQLEADLQPYYLQSSKYCFLQHTQ